MSADPAGPRRVAPWLDLNGDPRQGDRYDLADWVELIPFSETRNYVHRVLEARNLYRERLAQGEVARIPFLQVAGPLRPPPLAALKPLGAARDARYAAIAATAPRPKLKPSMETSAIPTAPSIAEPIAAPTPAKAPEARLASAAQLAQSQPGERAAPIAGAGQTQGLPARMPRPRPLPVSFPADPDAAETDIAVWPELKPDAVVETDAGHAMDALSVIKAAAEPPPQPEPKPQAR
jgi:hypothetical protein